MLTNRSEGESPGDRIRNGLRGIFDQDGVDNWYVIPGNGAHDSDDANVLVVTMPHFIMSAE